MIFQTELLYLTRAELFKLLHQIVCEQPYVPQGSVELRNADTNRFNIRVERWRGRTCGPAPPARHLGHRILPIGVQIRSDRSGRSLQAAITQPPSEGPASTRAGSRPPADHHQYAEMANRNFPFRLQSFIPTN